MFSVTNEQQGKKIRMEKGGNLHIYIAIDASDSIDLTSFNHAKEIVKKLIDEVRILLVFILMYNLLLIALTSQAFIMGKKWSKNSLTRSESCLYSF